MASFPTASPIPVENWALALNDILPASIRVLEVHEVPRDFHARKSARAKTYRYRIYRRAVCPPFLARYVWHYPYPLDEAAMAVAAGVVVGKHDFTSFAAVDPDRVERMAASAEEDRDGAEPRKTAGTSTTAPSMIVPTNIREVFSSAWKREGDELIYTIRGAGFLHHMVRNLVGTFLLVGKGSVSLRDFECILAARERSAAGPTAPANGLYLLEVEY